MNSWDNPSISETISGVTIVLEGESSNANNNRPHFITQIQNPLTDAFVTIEVLDDDNEVHLWNHGQGNGAVLTNNFPGIGVISSWLEGNTNYTVGEIGGTANSVITAGAYTTKNQYVNYNGITQTIPFYTSHGDIAPFSSHGPTLDGRTKPDITSPGNVVVSSVNSFDPNYGPTNPHVVYSVNNSTNYWYFAAMQGTSMASPFTTGVVALMLQAKNNLTFSQVRTIFYSTARTDSYTGTITSTGSFIWGGGKINALGGVWDAENYTGISELSPGSDLFIYPNPSSGNFYITLEESVIEPYILEVYNVHGQCVQKSTITEEISQHSLNGNPEGVYYLRVYQGNSIHKGKLLLKY